MTSKVSNSNSEEEGVLERLGKRIDRASVWQKRIAAVIGIVMAITGGVATISHNVSASLDSHIEAQTVTIAEKIDRNTEAIQRNSEEIENIRLDTLRVQLLQYIFTEPSAHETILKLAYTYFVEYGGDWVMTDKFKEWAAAENVNIPFDLSH